MKLLYKAVGILFALMFTVLLPSHAYAADINSLGKGNYTVSASLSCYVNAMGGIEFGAPLLTETTLIVDSNGSKSIKMSFTKSSVTIYSITCDTFIDAAPSSTGSERGVKNGTIGYYDKNGNLKTDGVSHTLSDDTALNSRDEAVHYVNSITFPLDRISDTYNLTMYVNSNVMGVQFCNENSSATEATYSATLTVDWNTVSAGGSANAGSSGTSSSTGSGNSESSGGTTVSSSGNTAQASGGETQTTAGTEKETALADENVVEKDGLNIHYAHGGSGLDSGSGSDVPFYVYLNTPVLIGLAVFGGVLIIAGGILLLIAKRSKEKKANEQNI